MFTDPYFLMIRLISIAFGAKLLIDITILKPGKWKYHSYTWHLLLTLSLEVVRFGLTQTMTFSVLA